MSEQIIKKEPAKPRVSANGESPSLPLAVRLRGYWYTALKALSTHRITLLTTVVALSGGMLAFLHHAPVDAYVIGCEWIVFIGFTILTYERGSRRSAPLCHIIFVKKQKDEYIATTEYYRTSLSSGRILADALSRARAEGVCSVTYYEGDNQFHIPLTQPLTTARLQEEL